MASESTSKSSLEAVHKPFETMVCDSQKTLQSTTPCYTVPLQYYSVPQSTTPVLLSTTKYHASTTLLQSTTPYYSSTTKYYSVLQSTTPVYYSTVYARSDPHIYARSDPKFTPEAIQNLRPKRPPAPTWLGLTQDFLLA